MCVFVCVCVCVCVRVFTSVFVGVCLFVVCFCVLFFCMFNILSKYNDSSFLSRIQLLFLYLFQPLRMIFSSDILTCKWVFNTSLILTNLLEKENKVVLFVYFRIIYMTLKK